MVREALQQLDRQANERAGTFMTRRWQHAVGKSLDKLKLVLVCCKGYNLYQLVRIHGRRSAKPGRTPERQWPDRRGDKGDEEAMNW